MDEFTYEANHLALNTLLVTANMVKEANNQLPLDRRTRERLFLIEDRLDDAINVWHDMMDDLFSDHPGYRRWGMKEGWIDPRTEEEEQWYEENVTPDDHASPAEKANRSREWQGVPDES